MIPLVKTLAYGTLFRGSTVMKVFPAPHKQFLRKSLTLQMKNPLVLSRLITPRSGEGP